MKRAVAGLVVLFGLVAGLIAPAQAATTLTITATSATTNLTPGRTVTARVAGAGKQQVLRYGVCATGSPCAPTAAIRTGSTGAAAISVRVDGTATHVQGGTTHVKACRPDRCQVVVHPDGKPAAIVRLPIRFVGERVSATVSPGIDLVDGRVVTVAGRVKGAEGRTVRAIQTDGRCVTGSCTATVGQGTVRADGTFSFAGPVRLTLPATGGGCAPAPGSSALGPCQVAVSVVGDPSFGIAAQAVRFLATGLEVTATPQFDLVDRQAVGLTGADAGLAGRQVRIRQLACDVVDPSNPICSAGPSVVATLDARGRLNATLAVRRFVGPEDCARNRYPSPECRLEVVVLNSRQAPDTLVAATSTPVHLRPIA